MYPADFFHLDIVYHVQARWTTKNSDIMTNCNIY